MRKAWNVVPLGGCCWCGGSVNECRAIGMVHKKAPIAGTGWGCFQCGLPNDGAMAIACDACVESGLTGAQNPREVCVGNPGETALRAPYNELGEAFDHDLSKHPELQRKVAPEISMAVVPVLKADLMELMVWSEGAITDKEAVEYSGIERVLATVLSALATPQVQGVCQVCGCTEERACPGGCSWVNRSETLCSSCAYEL